MPSDFVPAVGPVRLTTNTLAPPHPLDAEWAMRVDGHEYGPFSGRQLEGFVREGRLEAHTEVRRLNGLSWSTAIGDPTLRRFFPEASKPPVTAQRAQEASHIRTGEGSTVVQVTNTIQAPPVLAAVDLGADKSPGLALLLSLLICGAGQLYNGDVGKGILMFFGCILLWVFFLGWIINIWSIIDAYSRAKSLRETHLVYIANTRRW